MHSSHIFSISSAGNRASHRSHRQSLGDHPLMMSAKKLGILGPPCSHLTIICPQACISSKVDVIYGWSLSTSPASTGSTTASSSPHSEHLMALIREPSSVKSKKWSTGPKSYKVDNIWYQTCWVQASLALALEEPEGLDVPLPPETGLPYS